MAGIVIEKGKTIHANGQPFNSLHLITAGQVLVTFPGGNYTLGKGDVIGICEICSEVHFLNYLAIENTSLVSYHMANQDALFDLLRKYRDVSRFFLLSAFRQFNLLQQQFQLAEMKCSNTYMFFSQDVQTYHTLSARYRTNRPLLLEDAEELNAYLNDEETDLWLGSYYQGLYQIYAGEDFMNFLEKIAVSVGSLRKCSVDFHKIYTNLDEQYQYLLQILSLYFNENSNDLFDHYTELLNKLGTDSAELSQVLDKMEHMAQFYQETIASPQADIMARIKAFYETKAQLNTSRIQPQTNPVNAPFPKELTDSLTTILSFAKMPPEFETEFRSNVQKYRRLPDMNGSDEQTYSLRRALIPAFLDLYEAIFKTTLQAAQIPLPVKMFLFFGYIDEDLAGEENSIYLSQLAQKLEAPGDHGVYTFYHWLLAIYQGKKEPSRNEFDMDFSEYVNNQFRKGQCSKTELTALLNDPWEKVAYELHNMFPSVNKMTFGRITTYCPLFHRNNVLKNLSDCLVTASKIGQALETIKRVDYSAFYRESLDYDHIDAMGKEQIHLEFLPDIILMPNVGIHGVMWQEIEGKKRNSSGRMMYSIFHMEDVTNTMIHLTGEFRWEMCKRVYGARWNDISEVSLTSEYFDYIQFYRKNHDLSSENKDKVGIALKRAKNSFKEMFIRDYQIWILFEGSGAPRLNKVARRILFTHCPFPADIDRALAGNPLYTELLQRKHIKNANRLHHLENLSKKLSATKYGIPETLQKEIEFTEYENKNL